MLERVAHVVEFIFISLSEAETIFSHQTGVRETTLLYIVS
jgi:hypothetical protein